MSNIILQPTSDKKAREHFFDTITNGVDINIITKYVDKTLTNVINNLYPGGKVYVWGVTNGENDSNKRKWEKIKSGDVTLFSRDGKIFKSAVTTLTFPNKKLALDLWGTKEGEDTWENIYLVDEIKSLDITYKEFNKIVGYSEKYIIQGFNVLDDKKSESLLSYLDLYSDKYFAEVNDKEYEDTLNSLMDEIELDKKISGKVRKEQAYLRKILFKNNKIYKCGICGQEYPIDLLVTAHIKKRSDCTKEERLDVKNIVMPMCKFGCDDLYEKGYILVKDGLITKNENKFITDKVKEQIEKLENMTCSYWNENTKKYFEYHNKNFIN